MEGLVRYSFYCFAGGSMALIAASMCYIIYTFGRVKFHQATAVSSAGPVQTGSSVDFSSGALGFGRFGTLLTLLGCLSMGLAFVLRTIAAGHVTLTNMYEFSLGFTFCLTASYLIFERIYRVRQLGAVAVSVAALMSIYIWMLPPDLREINQLIPALQAGWILPVHVGTANLSYATLAISFGAAVLYLIKSRFNVRWLPSLDMLDDIGFRAVTIGFPLFTIMLILGSVWAHEAWGTYWQWDPKETAALFTWLIYGIYLHTRTLRGWRGNRSAWILVFGFFAMAFTYYGNYFFGGLHAYGGV